MDPTDFGGLEEEKKLVLGGEVCLWGEFVNSINVIPRLWPRGSAAAEVLWSPNQLTQQSIRQALGDAAARLQEHECRMVTRGYPVEPVVGAGYCRVQHMQSQFLAHHGDWNGHHNVSGWQKIFHSFGGVLNSREYFVILFLVLLLLFIFNEKFQKSQL